MAMAAFPHRIISEAAKRIHDQLALERVGTRELVGIEIEQRRALGAGAGEVVIRHGRAMANPGLSAGLGSGLVTRTAATDRRATPSARRTSSPGGWRAAKASAIAVRMPGALANPRSPRPTASGPPPTASQPPP